jgi:hypothetical protein
MEKISIKETNFCYIILMLAYIMLSVIVVILLPDNAPVWVSTCLGEVIFVSPLLVFLAVKRLNPIKILKFSKIGPAQVVLAYIAAYCLLPFVMLLNYLTSFFAANYVDDMMLEVYEYPFAAQLFLMALMPAVVEEFIFRGFFYTSYRRSGVLKGAFMSGFLFGMAHLNINQFVYAFFMGIVFCIIYEASENATLSMITHFAINAHTVILMNIPDEATQSAALEVSEAVDASAITSAEIWTFIIILAGLSAVGLALFLVILNKLAKLHGRAGISEVLIKKDAPEHKERVMDAGMVLFVVAVFAYMILAEII